MQAFHQTAESRFWLPAHVQSSSENCNKIALLVLKNCSISASLNALTKIMPKGQFDFSKEKVLKISVAVNGRKIYPSLNNPQALK